MWKIGLLDYATYLIDKVAPVGTVGSGDASFLNPA